MNIILGLILAFGGGIYAAELAETERQQFLGLISFLLGVLLVISGLLGLVSCK